jgi:hypothetical protein
MKFSIIAVCYDWMIHVFRQRIRYVSVDRRTVYFSTGSTHPHDKSPTYRRLPVHPHIGESVACPAFAYGASLTTSN